MMKKLFLIAFFFLLSHANAQLNGTYTIGPTNSNYPTVTSAIQDLVANGISGPVVFNIKDFSSAFPSTYSIPNITGTSLTNTITFQSENPTVQSNPGGSFSIGSNANNIIINNLNMYTKGIVMANGVHHITVSNCVFSGGSTPSLDYYNWNESNRISSSYIVVNGDQINIANNTFYGYGTAVFKSNNSIYAYTNDLSITGNTFRFTSITPIYVSRVRNLLVDNNIYTSQDVYRALEAGSLAGNNVISNNKIFTTSQSIGTSFSIYMWGTAAEVANLTFKNNFVSTKTSTAITSNFKNINVYNNSFSSNDSYGLGLVTTAYTESLNVYNNVFNSTEFYPNMRVYSGIDFNKFRCDNNAFSKESKAIQYFTQYTGEDFYYDVQQWKAFSNKDLNSKVVGDVYVSNTDFHTPNAFMLDGTGMVLAAVASDIDNQARNTVTPDIGADEFNMDVNTYLDLEIVSIASPTNIPCQDSGVVLSIKNNSVLTVNSFEIECSVNKFRGNVTPYNVTILPNQTIQVSLNNCMINKNTFYDRFDFYVSKPNNQPDNNYGNNVATILNVFQLGDFVINVENSTCSNFKKLSVPMIQGTTVLWSTNETTNTINVTAPGQYWARITDSQGCQLTKTVTIN
ncbi:right-handed parallel beta-helix repeat-containing protein [Flavobacterium pedocola]